jgi:uncharacterized protein (TIGR03435 family)
MRHETNHVEDAKVLPGLLEAARDSEEPGAYEHATKVVRDTLGVDKLETYYSLLMMDGQDMLHGYTPKDAAALKPAFRSAKSPMTWTGMDAFVSAVCFNTVVAQQKGLPKPTTWADLLNPAYKGQIAMPNPNSSGTGFLTVAGWIASKGEAPAFEFMGKLHDNVAVYTHSGSAPCNNAARGEYAVGISLDMRSVTLKGAIAWSWSVMDNEVKGPGWLERDFYDVIAKTDARHTEDELRRMFQAVLAERFGVVVHTERKEVKAYVLTVDKKGLKMTETAADGESLIEPNPKRMALTMQRTSMPQLASVISRVMQTPVVDETQLKGRYDAVMDMTKYAQEMRPAEGAPMDMANLMTTTLREEIGLRIVSQKATIDIIVVDHAEKLPQAN